MVDKKTSNETDAKKNFRFLITSIRKVLSELNISYKDADDDDSQRLIPINEAIVKMEKLESRNKIAQAYRLSKNGFYQTVNAFGDVDKALNYLIDNVDKIETDAYNQAVVHLTDKFEKLFRDSEQEQQKTSLELNRKLNEVVKNAYRKLFIKKTDEEPGGVGLESDNEEESKPSS